MFSVCRCLISFFTSKINSRDGIQFAASVRKWADVLHVLDLPGKLYHGKWIKVMKLLSSLLNHTIYNQGQHKVCRL